MTNEKCLSIFNNKTTVPTFSNDPHWKLPLTTRLWIFSKMSDHLWCQQR